MPLNIKVLNPSGVQKGIKELRLHGQPLTRHLIPLSRMKAINDVLVVMG